jgi:hypothetical protein
MAFLTDTFARAAFKKLQGLAHTSATKDLANEAEASNIQLSTKEIYADTIAPDPNTAVAEGVAAFVSLELQLDPSSNGKAYFATIGSITGTGLEGKTNPRTGNLFDDGDRVGDLIPTKYGENYRAILYSNDVEVAPLSSEDWFLDYKSGIITSEDNLSLISGRLDGYVYIGDYLSDVDFSSSAIYPFASGDFDPFVTIYVSVDGNDDTGDGSISNPYRQPKRALQDIILPAGAGAYLIQCGAGEFEAPYFDAFTAAGAPDSLYINIVGDYSSSIEDVTSNTYIADVNRFASWSTTVTGFSAADPYSYWVRGEFSYYPEWPYGTPVLSSGSNTLTVPYDINGYYDEVATLHPFATTFVIGNHGITGNASDAILMNRYIQFTGIKFQAYTRASVKNVWLSGCTISTDSPLGSLYFMQTYADFTGTSGSLVAYDPYDSSSLSGWFSGTLKPLGYNIYYFNLNVSGGQHLLLQNEFCYLSDVDFSGTTTKIRMYNSTIRQVGDVSFTGNGLFVELNDNSFYNILLGEQIIGSRAGVLFDVNSGSQFVGIKEAADGNVSNTSVPGAEINVGGLTNLALADLPKTDFGLGDLSQGCRAT